MNAKQAITVAAVLGATALGLAVPAYADDFDHNFDHHGPSVTEHQCRHGDGHVREQGEGTLTPAPTAMVPMPVPVTVNNRYCSGGKYSGQPITVDN